ncbi:MAG: hypothetical protein LAO09_07155 [Acidobacteriia bacterium]|nr:hypothetical protein [Terriglobia bacterium]
MSRPKLQARMRALSFDEKIKILEKLRDRDKAIAASGLKRKAVQASKNTLRNS